MQQLTLKKSRLKVVFPAGMTTDATIQTIPPIITEHAAIFINEFFSLFSSNGPNFISRALYKRITFSIEDKEFAKASPPCLRGIISRRLKTMFVNKDITAIRTGVFVSFKA